MSKSVSAGVRASLLLILLSLFVSPVTAQTVPSPWIVRDIGAPTLAGSATHSSGVFTIDGAGTGITGVSDQATAVYQVVAGDMEIIARVDSLTNVGPETKAGVVVRASLYPNAAHGSALVSASSGTAGTFRVAGAKPTTTQPGSSAAAPTWVRAVRAGNVVTAYRSTDGAAWTAMGSATIALGSSAYVGVAVTSGNTGTRATARISNLVVRKLALALPSGQQNVDLGAPAVKGGATHSSGTYTIQAGGADIWDVADQFHFVYQPITGNAEVIARVASITYTHDWAKVGVMIRESLTAQSRHVLVAASVGKGYAFQRRPEPGQYSVHTTGGTGTPPGWVRLVRTGDLFEAYRSADGVSWTRFGSDTIPMTATVYVGLAATSHNTAAATTATVTNFKVTATQTSNQPPAVSITAPATGTQVNAGATVAITATATDPENRMASVDFYAGSTLIVRDTAAPYSATWSAPANGTHALTAVAHDADGASTTSSGVNVTVRTANAPPTVSLSTGGTSFTAPASITLSATAADPEGQLARVEFFNGSSRLGTDTSAPYSFSWTGVAAGTYTLTAVAYDAAGASASSAAVTVTVGAAATTPPRWIVFTASSNHATSVTSYLLEVFAAGANPATATPVATSNLGKPAPAANGDITVDRATFFSALAAGNYIATVTAVGSAGEAASAGVAFTR